MFKKSRLFLWTILLSGIVTSPVFAKMGETDYARVNRVLAVSHVLPRYEAFAKAAKDFDAAAQVMCREIPSGNLDATQKAFKNALGAWMDIQHVLFGPIETLMRNFRIHHWPDKSSGGQKQFNALLANDDPSAFAPDKFPSVSIAVQGYHRHLPG